MSNTNSVTVSETTIQKKFSSEINYLLFDYQRQLEIETKINSESAGEILFTFKNSEHFADCIFKATRYITRCEFFNQISTLIEDDKIFGSLGERVIL